MSGNNRQETMFYKSQAGLKGNSHSKLFVSAAHPSTSAASAVKKERVIDCMPIYSRNSHLERELIRNRSV